MKKKYGRTAIMLGLTGREQNDRDDRARASAKWRDGYARCLQDILLVQQRVDRRFGGESKYASALAIDYLERGMRELKAMPTDGDLDSGHDCRAATLLCMAIARMDRREYARVRSQLKAIPHKGTRASALHNFSRWTVKRFVREARRALSMLAHEGKGDQSA